MMQGTGALHPTKMFFCCEKYRIPQILSYFLCVWFFLSLPGHLSNHTASTCLLCVRLRITILPRISWKKEWRIQFKNRRLRTMAFDNTSGKALNNKVRNNCKKISDIVWRLFLLCCRLFGWLFRFRLLCRCLLCCCHGSSTSYRKGLLKSSIYKLINILVATPFLRIESL